MVNFYVGTTDVVKRGDWVLGRWEREYKLKHCGSSTSLTQEPSYHMFIVEDNKISNCKNCDSRPKLNRYHGSLLRDIEHEIGWKIYCDQCGGIETSIGKNLEAVKKYWNRLNERTPSSS